MSYFIVHHGILLHCIIKQVYIVDTTHLYFNTLLCIYSIYTDVYTCINVMLWMLRYIYLYSVRDCNLYIVYRFLSCPSNAVIFFL